MTKTGRVYTQRERMLKGFIPWQLYSGLFTNDNSPRARMDRAIARVMEQAREMPMGGKPCEK